MIDRENEDFDGRSEIRRILFVVGVKAEEYERRLGERFFGGNLSFVHAGRKMYFPVKNADDERLRVRLQILSQPQERRRTARGRFARRNVRIGHGLLPPQLYRRLIPLVRRL